MSRTNGLNFALDERYITKDYCENKKQRYISKELCEAKESALNNNISDIKETCREIKENHIVMQNNLANMERDISEMKMKVALITSVAALAINVIFQIFFR